MILGYVPILKLVGESWKVSFHELGICTLTNELKGPCEYQPCQNKKRYTLNRETRRDNLSGILQLEDKKIRNIMKPYN